MYLRYYTRNFPVIKWHVRFTTVPLKSMRFPSFYLEKIFICNRGFSLKFIFAAVKTEMI